MLSNDGSNVIGQKSADEDAQTTAAQKKAKLREKRKRSKQEDGPKPKYTKSASVFKHIEDAKALKGSAADSKTLRATSSSLKL